tara:strand:+ start:439 stop:597 length:159 start_codon:yes stop_codon:yes gene_type:complete
MMIELNVTGEVDKRMSLAITEMVHDILIEWGHGVTAFDWELKVTLPNKDDEE